MASVSWFVSSFSGVVMVLTIDKQIRTKLYQLTKNMKTDVSRAQEQESEYSNEDTYAFLKV